MTRRDWYSILAPFSLWMLAAFGRGLVWEGLRPPEPMWVLWIVSNSILAGATGAAIASVYCHKRNRR